LEVIGAADGAAFPDDVTVDNDGTVYWTDVVRGTVFARDAITKDVTPFFDDGTYPNANPLTLSDDGNRLFFSQCYNYESLLGVYEIDLVTGDTTTIVDGIPLCASNALDYHNGSLWSPRPFEQRIVRIDLGESAATGDRSKNVDVVVTNVTTGLVSVAARFDSEGQLYALDNSKGQVVRIDLTNSDLANNREVVAQFPNIGLDNFAFDKDDRLFVSSFTRGYVQEVNVTSGELRIVSQGNLSVTSGVAVHNGIVYTATPLMGIFGYDVETGEQVYAVEDTGGTNVIPPAIGVAAGRGASDKNLFLTSFLYGVVAEWDVANQVAVHQCIFAGGPNDVLAIGGENSILVLEVGSGTVWNVTGCGTDTETREEVFVASPEAGLRNIDGDDQNVFLTQVLDGQVLQIIKDSKVLQEPLVISSGHDQLEGIALLPGGEEVVVVATGTGTVEKINIATGTVTELAEGLGFFPGLGEATPFGYSNDVAIYDGHAFVNADMDNVIYKIPLDKKTDGEDDAGDDDAATGLHSIWQWTFTYLCISAFFDLLD
jgi:sugar lactone lactonase YvrE